MDLIDYISIFVLVIIIGYILEPWFQLLLWEILDIPSKIKELFRRKDER